MTSPVLATDIDDDAITSWMGLGAIWLMLRSQAARNITAYELNRCGIAPTAGGCLRAPRQPTITSHEDEDLAPNDDLLLRRACT